MYIEDSRYRSRKNSRSIVQDDTLCCHAILSTTQSHSRHGLRRKMSLSLVGATRALILLVDIWAVGCIFGEMIRSQVIFLGSDRTNRRRRWCLFVAWRHWSMKWNHWTIGTPSKEFLSRLKPTLKNSVENWLKHAGYCLDEWFPDQLLPADSERTKLTGSNICFS